MYALKDLPKEELFSPGHRLCAGCAQPISVRMITKVLRGPTVIVSTTGCLEVSSSIYPHTAWRVPWVHVAFENGAAVASGIEAAFKIFRKKGVLKDKVDVIAICGDGGTYDIGIQAISGALERGHDFVYICHDNEAYMNTGIQRSGATPKGAATTTSPAGTKIPGKPEWKKDFIGICIAHGIEYAATATPAYWGDFLMKVRKAIEVDGPAVINVLAPCPLGWRYEPKDTIRIARLAVLTRYFPIYEYEKGKYKLNIKVSKPLPVEEFLKVQGRFRHLFKPEFKKDLEEIKHYVEENWNRILRLCGET